MYLPSHTMKGLIHVAAFFYLLFFLILFAEPDSLLLKSSFWKYVLIFIGVLIVFEVFNSFFGDSSEEGVNNKKKMTDAEARAAIYAQAKFSAEVNAEVKAEAAAKAAIYDKASAYAEAAKAKASAEAAKTEVSAKDYAEMEARAAETPAASINSLIARQRIQKIRDKYKKNRTKNKK